jgi:hypothetical protein
MLPLNTLPSISVPLQLILPIGVPFLSQTIPATIPPEVTYVDLALPFFSVSSPLVRMGFAYGALVTNLSSCFSVNGFAFSLGDGVIV